MKTLLLTFYSFVLVFTVYSQNFNRPVPNGIFPYEYTETGGVESGYVLTTLTKLQVPPQDPNFVSPYPVLFDKDGYITWYSKPVIGNATDFKYFESINRYVYTFIKQGVVYALVMDDQFNAVDTLTTSATRDVHDLQVANNGNWLIATAYFDTMDLSAYTFNGTQGGTAVSVKGFGYEEIDPAGTLVGWYNSNSNVHPTETYDFWGYNANNFDYCHGNAIEEDVDGNLLLSHRHLNSIHKIDRQTGDIIWRLGGELSDFTFVNDGGFSGQHDMRRLANGELSLFDNGNMSGITRGVRYELDTTNWTATRTGEYIHPAGATSSAMGSYQITASSIEVIGYGLIYRPEPSAVIVDTNHNELAAFYFQDSVVGYRFLHFELDLPNRPEITCNWNGTNWELIAPTGQSEYAWSTGETTNSIQLTQTGTYQVWVDQGVGMLGSLPFTVTNLNNPCSVGIDDLTLDEDSFEWYTVLGIKVDQPAPNNVYLKVFKSGKIEKVVTTN